MFLHRTAPIIGSSNFSGKSYLEKTQKMEFLKLKTHRRGRNMGFSVYGMSVLRCSTLWLIMNVADFSLNFINFRSRHSKAKESGTASQLTTFCQCSQLVLHPLTFINYLIVNSRFKNPPSQWNNTFTALEHSERLQLMRTWTKTEESENYLQISQRIHFPVLCV